MPDEHGRLLDELLELRSMAVAVQRSGEVIVRNHIFAISFSGLPHTVHAFLLTCFYVSVRYVVKN